MISPDEYQALPASIRKKYFSSHERLQIARQYAAERRKRQKKKSWLPSPLPPPAQSTTQLETVPKSPSRRQHTSRLTATQETVSEDEALWFLSLPDKVKRRHFSREEQVLLTERCETTLRSGSPESALELYRRSLPVEREESSSCVPGCRSLVPPRVIDEEAVEAIASAAETFSLRSQAEEPEEPEDQMAIFNLHAHRRSLATAHANPPQPYFPPAFTTQVLPTRQKRSFRRSFALKPIALPAPTLAPVPSTPTSPRSFSDRPALLRRNRTTPNFSSPELSPDAKHYRDPEARKTLQDLASPQKLDEAIKFGFPLQGPGHEPEQGQGSFESEESARSYSLTFSSSGDEEGSPNSPVTPTLLPSAPEPTIAHAKTSSSLEDGCGLPLQHSLQLGSSGKTLTETRRPTSIGHPVSASQSGGGREMTLHMTLTRPDLRSPLDTNYDTSHGARKDSGLTASTSAGAESDPLALEQLPVCDDPSGLQGAFAVREDAASTGQGVKGLKRVWKNLRGR